MGERAYGHIGPVPLAPTWAQSWEFPFFTSLVAVSLAIKKLFRIQ